jgi:RNA polymerase sigma-70 factor (ECF subfamily)
MTTRREDISVDDLIYKISLYNDESAFHELYIQFFTPLCVYAQRYIASQAACEDIVQTTFLKIWEDRHSYEVRVSGKNLLVTYVKNACIDYLRKRMNEQEYIKKTSQVANERCGDSEDIYSIRELEQMLSKALARLPGNVRRVFEKNRFEKKTYKEIAQEEKLSVKSIEKYMSKALKILHEALKNYLAILL